MLKSRGSLPWTVQRYPKAKITEIVFQKCKSLSKKCKPNRPSASLRLKQETGGRPDASKRKEINHGDVRYMPWKELGTHFRNGTFLPLDSLPARRP